MRKILIFTILFASGCSDSVFSSAPNDQEMRLAYLQTDEVRLGGDLLGGKVQLTEFRKVDCQKNDGNFLKCRFYAKFGTPKEGDKGQEMLSHLISSQTGFFREAIFFKNEAGNWVCTNVEPTKYAGDNG